MNLKKQFAHGFTIIELLVVIVIIGILTAIVYVGYDNIQAKTLDTSVLSDIDTMDAAQTSYGVANRTAGKAYYSGSGYDGDLDFAPSSGNIIDVVADSTGYCIRGYNVKANKNSIDNPFIKESKTGICSTILPSPATWPVIGTQTWAKANLNVGTMVTGVTDQTNNSILEKYCYGNLESNCTTYGGLYQWDEAMQYVTTNGAQGICPTGSHIPSDNDWKILEVQLGMSQAQADATSWRGTDQGTQLKPSGTSGLNMPLAGYRGTDGSFNDLSSGATLWSSSESSTSAWVRDLSSGYASVNRGSYGKAVGFSVRCLGN